MSLVSKLLTAGVGTKTSLKGASASTLKELLDTGVYEVPQYHTIYEKLVRGETTKEPTKLYNWMKLNSVTFPMPNVTYDQFAADPAAAARSPRPWGEVEYFLTELRSKLGSNWAKKVLAIYKNPKTGEEEPVHDLSKVRGVKRLGVPGRQGTVIKLTFNGIDYAIKVAAKTTSCGDGSTGGMGFLKQARLQQIAAEWGVTCPVYAVHCIPGKKEMPFMAMPMMGQRLVDIYGYNGEWSEQHQKEFWNLRLLMDTYVGMVHNDGNCLNVMTDPHGNVKLIDFDRSYLMDPKHNKDHGFYNNLCFMPLHGCFRNPNNGKVLRKAMEKLYPSWKTKNAQNIYRARYNKYKGVRYYIGSSCERGVADPKGAVFFQPFKLIEPAVAVFPPQASAFDALRSFCRDQKHTQWEKLSVEIIASLVEVAEWCIAKKKGNQDLADKIIDYASNNLLYREKTSRNGENIN